MIDIINLLMTKKSVVQLTNFSFLFQTDIATTIVLFLISVDNTFIITLSMTYKNKSMKLNKTRLYKNLNINEHVC